MDVVVVGAGLSGLIGADRLPQVDGEDISQHSWGSVQGLRADRDRLQLSRFSRIADPGYGTCGVLTDIVAAVGYRDTGDGRASGRLARSAGGWS